MNHISTEEFAGKVVTDIGATMSGVLTLIGHKLGLYKALAQNNSMTSSQLAQETGTHERYIREWLNNQVTGGYVLFDGDDGYSMPKAYIPVLAEVESPMFLIPALEVASSLWADEDLISQVFQSGEGISWGQHNHRLFCGSESLFRPGYKSFLVSSWIDSMENMKEQLVNGITVADVGCGHGASTIVLAKAFPNSVFYGFDSHLDSIETAKQRALDEGGLENLHFMVSDAKSYPKENFGLICFMDCLHDMGDPVGAAKYAKSCLSETGSLLIVEPAAADELNDNINPVSRLYYAASTAVCTPCSLSQEVGLALGAQAGEKRLSEVISEAGFKYVKRVAETPFNMVLEAK